MSQTLNHRAGLRLVHSRADTLGDLLDRIEREERPAHRPVPLRLYVIGYAVVLIALLCAVLP